MKAQEMLSNRWVQVGVAFVVGVATCWFMYPTKTIEERVKESVTTQYEEKLKEVEKQNISTIEKMELEQEKLTLSLKEEHRVETTSLSSKILKLQEENRSLKSSSTVEWVKITRPDGTIEERRVSKKEMEELSSTIQRVQAESETKTREEIAKIEASKQQEIAKLKESMEEKIFLEKKRVEEKDSIIESLKEKASKITVNEKKFGIGVGVDTDFSYSGSVTYQFFGPLFLGLRIDMKNDLSVPRAGISLGVML